MAPLRPDHSKATQAELEAGEGESTVAKIKSTFFSTTQKLGDVLHAFKPANVMKSSKKHQTLTTHNTNKRVVTSLKDINSHTIPPPDNTHKQLSCVRSPAPPEILTPRSFELGGTLGRGKFGRVYLARHVATNFICALKIISKAQCIREAEEPLIRRELEVHQNLAHKNILKLFAWFHDEKSIYLVLEYAVGGNLFSKLHKQPNRRFDERTAARYVAQVTEALKYMHDKNIMHRDIKPENILLGLHNDIKLADFGYSVHSSSGLRSTLVGTIDYLSPEVASMVCQVEHQPDQYTKAVDQWSLGVLMYELLVGKPPFEMKSQEKTQAKIAAYKGKGVRFPEHVSPEARHLVRKLLRVDANDRMEFEDVLVHPWVSEHVEFSRLSGSGLLEAY